MARLLERYDAMQRRPFGTNTALSDGTQRGVGGVVGSQFRRQGAAYGQALRILNRAARRGDARSAMASIDVRQDAMDRGYSPGGIRQKEQADSGILSRVNALDQRNQGIERATGYLGTMERENADTVNPNATAGAGRGEPIIDPKDIEQAKPIGTAPDSTDIYDKLPEGANGGMWVDVSPKPGAPVAPAATLTPTAPVEPAPLTLAEQDALAKKKSRASGAFGKSRILKRL